jgi:hypothetical protein
MEPDHLTFGYLYVASMTMTTAMIMTRMARMMFHAKVNDASTPQVETSFLPYNSVVMAFLKLQM